MVETVYCGIISGCYTYRGSLLYGPVNLIYGIGALTLFFSLRKIDASNKIKVFTIGAIAGTIVEYLCSFFQEVVFGTVSWDYSDMPFNIAGRVNLLYALFWGALALLWVYSVYPGFMKLMRKIPDVLGRKLAAALVIALLLDIALSATAVARWTSRMEGIPAMSPSAQFMDQMYPDTQMEQIFASMKYVVR